MSGHSQLGNLLLRNAETSASPPPGSLIIHWICVCITSDMLGPTGMLGNIWYGSEPRRCWRDTRGELVGGWGSLGIKSSNGVYTWEPERAGEPKEELEIELNSMLFYSTFCIDFGYINSTFCIDFGAKRERERERERERLSVSIATASNWGLPSSRHFRWE